MNSPIGPAGILHLVVFTLLLPWGAIVSARRLERNPLPPRLHFYLSVIIQHAAFITLSVIVAGYESIPIWKMPDDAARAVVVALCFLIIMIVIVLPQWRRSVIEGERKVWLFMPSGAPEKSLWGVISLAAGIGEEISYRAVLWVVLTRLTGSILIAAILASVIFAFSHYVQGWKSVVAIFFFSLSFHWLVSLTGSIVPGMVVHALYDFTAGMMYRRFGDRYGYEGSLSADPRPAEW